MQKTMALLFFGASLALGTATHAADAGKDDQTKSESSNKASKKEMAPKTGAPPAMRSRSINPPQPPSDMGNSDGGRTDDPIGGLPGHAPRAGEGKQP